MKFVQLTYAQFAGNDTAASIFKANVAKAANVDVTAVTIVKAYDGSLIVVSTVQCASSASATSFSSTLSSDSSSVFPASTYGSTSVSALALDGATYTSGAGAAFISAGAVFAGLMSLLIMA